MSRYFIVGATGESARWLVDTESQQVQQIDLADLGEDKSPIVRGVAVAISAESRNGLTAHQVAPST